MKKQNEFDFNTKYKIKHKTKEEIKRIIKKEKKEFERVRKEIEDR